MIIIKNNASNKRLLKCRRHLCILHRVDATVRRQGYQKLHDFSKLR